MARPLKVNFSQEKYSLIAAFLNLLGATGNLRLGHFAIAASAFGDAYGIIFSSNWNLFTLARNKHTVIPSLLTAFNRHGIAWMCVIAEAFVCLTYLALTRGSQVPLQQITGLGCVLAYTVSVASLIYAQRRLSGRGIAWWIPYLGLVNCALLITLTVKSLLHEGLVALLTFGGFLLLGGSMFLYRSRCDLRKN